MPRNKSLAANVTFTGPALTPEVVPTATIVDYVTPSDLMFEEWEHDVYSADPTGGQPSIY